MDSVQNCFVVGWQYVCFVELEVYFDVFGNFIIIICIDGYFVVFFMFDVFLFVRVIYVEIEVMFFRSICDVDIVVCNEFCLEDFVLLVCICILVVEVEQGIFLVCYLFVIEFFKLGCIYYFDFVYYVFLVERGVDVDQCLFFFGMFGGYDNYIVGIMYIEYGQ